MTIQIYGWISIGWSGEKEIIEEYRDNVKEAQEYWESFLEKYDTNPKIHGELIVIKNEESNIRPKTGYGENPQISGTLMGNWQK